MSKAIELPQQEATTETSDIPRKEIFDVLSNDRRQYLLHYLKQKNGDGVELRELVDQVAAWENDIAPHEIGSAERKRVYTALRQSHLPKLDDAGIVEYDNRRGTVELTEQAREVQLYLEYVPENDIPWSEFYLGLSGVALALVAVTWIGVYPFDGLSGLVLATVLTVIFGVSAVVHTYRSRQNRLGSDKFDVKE